MPACNTPLLIHFSLHRPAGAVLDPSLEDCIRRHIEKAAAAFAKDPDASLDRLHEGQLGHWLDTDDPDVRCRAEHWIIERASQLVSTGSRFADTSLHAYVNAQAFWCAPICIVDDWPYDSGAVLYTGESAQVFRFVFKNQDDARVYEKVRKRLLEYCGSDDAADAPEDEDSSETEDNTETSHGDQRDQEFPSHRRIVATMPYVHIGGYIAGLSCLFPLAAQDIQSSVAADIVARCLAQGSNCSVRSIAPCAGGVLTYVIDPHFTGSMPVDAYDPKPIDKDITSLPAISYEALRRVLDALPHGLQLLWRPSGQLSEDEQRLQKAKQFLLHAVKHHSHGEHHLALVLAVAGLEQLLAPPKDAPIGTTLALYAAVLHERDQRERVHQQVLTAYRARCHIVHHGVLKIPHDRADASLRVVAATIAKAEDRRRELVTARSSSPSLNSFILQQLLTTAR